MIDIANSENQISCVENFEELISTTFSGEVNALCWQRELKGDFAEIINKISLDENMKVIDEEELNSLELTEHGQLARDILLNDLNKLKEIGAAPILNVIQQYERDDSFPFFPTDVYSFHVDRSPIPTDTYLCTYHGDSSEIIPNSQATQKVLIPEIVEELKKLYDGPEAGFKNFLSENFFDLHYEAKATSQPISLGIGHLWRLAIDHPESQVLPCLHRAPNEISGQRRLLLIC